MRSRLRKIWMHVETWLWLPIVLFVGVAVAMLRRKPPAPPAVPYVPRASEPSMHRADVHQREGERHAAEARQHMRQSNEARAAVSGEPKDVLLRRSQEYARRQRRAVPPPLPPLPKRRPGPGGSVLLLLCCMLIATVARAQESLPEVMAHPALGTEGWWIPDDTWRAAMADVEALDQCRVAVDELGQAGEAWAREREALKNVIAFERAQSDLMSVQLSRTREELAVSQRWYRSPRFLIPFGLVLGGVAGTWFGVKASQ